MAAREMEVHNVGSLVVTDEDQKLVGIITDRDLALGLAHGQLRMRMPRRFTPRDQRWASRQ